MAERRPRRPALRARRVPGPLAGGTPSCRDALAAGGAEAYVLPVLSLAALSAAYVVLLTRAEVSGTLAARYVLASCSSGWSSSGGCSASRASAGPVRPRVGTRPQPAGGLVTVVIVVVLVCNAVADVLAALLDPRERLAEQRAR